MVVMECWGRRPILSICQIIGGSGLYWLCISAGNLGSCPAPAFSITLPPRQVRGQRHLGDCVRLHGGDVPHSDQEPGGGNMLPGGQGGWRHQSPPRPPQGLLAPRSRLHHGCCGNTCRSARSILPRDFGRKTPRDNRRCSQNRVREKTSFLRLLVSKLEASLQRRGGL